MGKQLDGPVPTVSEAFRLLDRGSQNVAGVVRDGQRDHRGWQCDRATDCLILTETEPEQEWGQWVLRMAKGENTRRSEIDAEHLTAQLRKVRVAQLQQSKEEEVWLIADGSDPCKPYTQEMPFLMEVLDENEQLVPGHTHRNGSSYQPIA